MFYAFQIYLILILPSENAKFLHRMLKAMLNIIAFKFFLPFINSTRFT